MQHVQEEARILLGTRRIHPHRLAIGTGNLRTEHRRLPEERNASPSSAKGGALRPAREGLFVPSRVKH